jgi:hypothetical protein
LLTCSALAAFGYLFFPLSDVPAPRPFLIVWYGGLAALVMSASIFAAWQITRRATFHCRLSSQILECLCPVKCIGESFVVPVHEIAKIERHRQPGGESEFRWYIWDSSGNRYWLTDGYGNPVRRFVAQIKELCPSVPHVET